MLSANPRLGSGVSVTLVNLNSWVSSIGAGTTVDMQNPVSVKVRFTRPTDSIAVIAEKLTENARGIERESAFRIRGKCDSRKPQLMGILDWGWYNSGYAKSRICEG